MALIAQNSALPDFQAVNLTRTTLTASDTINYTPGSGQILVMYNTAAAAVTVTITGSAATSITPPGFGGTISLAGGKAVTVPLNGTTLLALDDISAFLPGTVTVAGGVGLVAHLFV